MKDYMMNEEQFFQDVKGAIACLYPDAYFSSWTSAEEHGLTNACANDYILFSDKISEDKFILLYNQKVYLKKISFINQKHIQFIPSANGGYKIADIYQTIIDCFYDTKLAGGKEILEEIKQNYLNTKNVNISTLIECAKECHLPIAISKFMKL